MMQFDEVQVPEHLRIVWGQGCPLWSDMGTKSGKQVLLKVGYTHAQNINKYPIPEWCELVNDTYQANSYYYFNQFYFKIQDVVEYMVENNLVLGSYGNFSGIYYSYIDGNNVKQKVYGTNYSTITRDGAIAIGLRLGGNATIILNEQTGQYDFPSPKMYYFLDEETYNRNIGNFYDFISGIFEGMEINGSTVNKMFYGAVVSYFINANQNTSIITDSAIESVMTGTFLGSWENTNLYCDASVGYYKTPGIENHTIYEKNNGNYVIDGNGKRVYLKEDFTKTYFGQQVPILKEPDDSIKYWITRYPTEFVTSDNRFGVEYVDNPGTEYVTVKEEWKNAGYVFNQEHGNPRPSGWRPETQLFVEQVYRYANSIILSKRILQNTENPSQDISVVQLNRKLKTGTVRRPRTEPFTTWGNSSNIREIGEQLLIFDVMFSLLAGVQAYDIWDDGGLVNSLSPQGNPFQGPGWTARSENWSRHIVITAAINRFMIDIAGTNPENWKHIYFYYPFKGEKNSEIISVGIYVGDKFIFNAFNPSLDYLETCNFTLKVGGSTFNYTLEGQKHFYQVVTVPTGLANTDFKLEYNNIYGVPIRVNGKITSTISEHYY
jgi:hypothetical protein